MVESVENVEYLREDGRGPVCEEGVMVGKGVTLFLSLHPHDSSWRISKSTRMAIR